MSNHIQIKMAKYLAAHSIGKTLTLAIFALLFLTAANLNANAQAADGFNPNITNGNVLSVANQSDGKTLIVGTFTQVSGQGRKNVARLNADGTLDATFNANIYTNSSSINAIVVQPDGKIIIGGYFEIRNQAGNQSIFINLARLESDGSPDSTFQNVAASSTPAVLSLAIQSDGKLLVGGTFLGIGGRNYFVRLNINGTIDSAFDPNVIGWSQSILIEPDGKILIGGAFTSVGGETRNRIARLNSNGTLDTNFNPNADSDVHIINRQINGKFLVGGQFANIGGAARRIARLNSDGSLDASFNPLVTGSSVTIDDIKLQPDGKIIFGGYFQFVNSVSRNYIARLNSDGNLDTNFNPNPDAAVFTVGLQTDGKILVGGTFGVIGGQPRNRMARLYSSELGEGTQPILFISSRDGNQEIYRMNVDGSNQQRLTNTPENEVFTIWSPDGSKILFTRQISTNVRQIWTMNADGSNQMRISSESVFATLYKYSPNGQKILFALSPALGTVNLWVMNANGSSPVQLTNNTGSPIEDHFPEWSPDGSKIAYGHCATPSYICDVFTMNSDGTNQTNLTPENMNDDDNPKWTNDGSRIVYGRTSTDHTDPYIMNANGGGKQPLGTFGANQFSSIQAISPDGNKVAFVLTDGATLTNHEIYTVGISGGTPVNITNNNVFDGFSAWSPDSAKIAFRSRRDTATDEIYTMNGDGSNVVRLTFNTTTDFVADWFKPREIKRAPFDFDGDGKSDVSIFRPSSGEWWLLRSIDNQNRTFTFGSSSDKMVPADFTGDGKTDVAFWRPNTGEWFVLRSEDFTYFAAPFGQSGDAPAPADFDADGKADLAVFRPSSGTWFINLSAGGSRIVPFGQTGDVPEANDYDGDGRADIAIFRPSTGEWWLSRSSLGQIVYQFGSSTDKPVPADYTGDGKTDVAFFRPAQGFWYILRSENSTYYGAPFGQNGDIPVPADYDGDGRADLAVFRPSDTNWYVNRTTAGFQQVQFGLATDKPVQAAFIP